jgi:hypothetical protein
MRATLFLLVLLFAGPSFAQAPEANEYWPLKQARIEAYRAHDRAFFERVLADDFVGLGPSGQLQTRQQYLDAEFGEGRDEGPSTQTEVSNFAATRNGSVLVLSYSEVERTPVGDNVFTEHLARLDVYIREHGRWRLRTMSAARIPQAPPVIEISAERLADYIGAYEFAPNARSVVTLEDGHLYEQTTGQERTELLPIASDTFYQPPNLEARIVFERGADGRVTTQIYRAGVQDLRGPLVGD